MSTLSVENFGPIKEAEVEIKKVTVFIGNQGAGKSTLAKLISTFSWIEKLYFRKGTINNFHKILEYHRIDNYVTEQTFLRYFGNAFSVDYLNYLFHVIPTHNNYSLPKITYFPAERSFLSSIKNTKDGQNFNLWSQSLQEFKEIFQEAKESMKDKLSLPINNTEIEYNQSDNGLYLIGNGYKIPLSESASGFQSFVPMFLVANYVNGLLKNEHEMSGKERETFKKESAAILSNPEYTDEQKRILLSLLAGKINIKRTLNIIEEPEQNLFPDSQRKMLNSLLEFNNSVAENQLILTTHSPYIINYLMLAIKAAELKEKANGNAEIENRINEIVPLKSLIPLKDVVIYEVNNDGTISELPQSYGLPSNENFLNNELGEANSLFSELMEIEDLCEQ
jgi:predicted ATPase